MTGHISRRQFLRCDYRGEKSVVRPPWATAPVQFMSLCDRCGHCRDVCAQRIITLADSGYPRIDFRIGECRFCGDCTRSCPTGALKKPDTSTNPWTLRARITERCLAHHGVVCLVCGEQCAVRAISFPRLLAKTSMPVVDPGRCNGCGACVEPCPAQAISMQYAGTPDDIRIKEAVCT